MDEDLGVAWLVKRLIVSKILKSRSAPDIADVDGILTEAGVSGTLVWKDMVPAIVRGMVGGGDLEREMAAEYAHRLGVDLDEVSNEALKAGYVASLNKGIDRDLSWRRVAEAWGLDGAQMRSFIGTMQEEAYSPDVIPRRSMAQLETMLNTRADRIRTNEGYAIGQLAQQIHWMKMRADGEVGRNAHKVWNTAYDERVCKVCGPIHRQLVRVDRQFSTGVFAPPVHPNCRCWVELVDYPEVVTKNLTMVDTREYNRDPDGKFASVNTLVSRPAPYKAPPKKSPPKPDFRGRPLTKAEIRHIQAMRSGRVITTFDQSEPAIRQLEKVAFQIIHVENRTVQHIQQKPHPDVVNKVAEVSNIIYESKVRAGKAPKYKLKPKSVRMEVAAPKTVDPQPESDAPYQTTDRVETQVKTFSAKPEVLGTDTFIAVVLPKALRDSVEEGGVIDFSQHPAMVAFNPKTHTFAEMGVDDTDQVLFISGATWHRDTFDEGVGVPSGSYNVNDFRVLSDDASYQIGLNRDTDVFFLAPSGADIASGYSGRGRYGPNEMRPSGESEHVSGGGIDDAFDFETFGAWEGTDRPGIVRAGNYGDNPLIVVDGKLIRMDDYTKEWLKTRGLTMKAVERPGEVNWGTYGLTNTWEKQNLSKRLPLPWNRKVF